jgi:hypothetical protein
MNFMPYTSFILIPIVIASILGYNAFLFYLLGFFSVFQGMSLINFTAFYRFGISPFYLISIFIFFTFLFELRENLIRIRNFLRKNKFLYLLFLFVFLSILSAFFLPILFKGMKVLIPRKSIGGCISNSNCLLEITISNIGQACYICLNALVIMFLISYISKIKKSILFMISQINIIVVIILAFWFRLHCYGKLKFPSNIFYTNPTYGFPFACPRVNGPFLEPSFLGAFISASVIAIISYILWLLFFRKIERPEDYFYKYIAVFYSLILLFLSFIILTFTRSTTGYGSFVISMFLLIMLFSFKLYSLKKLKKGRVKSWKDFIYIFFKILLLILVIFYVGWGITEKLGWKSSLLNSVLYEKTLAYVKLTNPRAKADIFSFRLFLKTYGLGVGLGSNRPSSFIAYILSNLGLWGFVLFFGFLLRLYYLSFRLIHLDGVLFFALFFSISMVVGMSFGVPDISFPPFWWSLFLLIVSYFKVKEELYEK